MLSNRSRALATAWSSLLVAAAFAFPATIHADAAAAKPPVIENASCTTKCHEDVKFKSPAHPDTRCAECHVNITLAPHDKLPDEQKLSADDVCAGCHGMAQKQLKKSVHKSKSCKTCHGKPHETGVASDMDSRLSSTGQVETCAKCHDDVIEGFKTSVHGEGLLKSGLTKSSPGCSSCHGTHNIQKHGDERSRISHANAPNTCGACHEAVLKHWKDESAHGLAWQAGKKGPVCTDCHMDSHSIKDPTSAAMRKHVPNDCGGCHKDVVESFRDSFHGKASELGWSAVAMCSDCHTAHQSLAASDPRSSVNPANLGATCGKCHEQEVKNAGFLTFDPHVKPTDPKTRPALRIVFYFMTALLLGVFAFFFAHDFLWLQRTVVGRIRGEYRSGHGGSGPYVKRFSNAQIWLHVSIVLSFLLLAITGLPLKFAAAPWADQMMSLLGGAHTAGLLHRFAAIVTFGYFAVHLFMVLYGWLVKGEKGFFWGWRSMVPQLKDVQDFWANIKYFLYVGPRPKIDRWAYWEKFDYLAVFWGVAMIGLSGLMLWQPGFFTRFVPGWVLNAAYIIHSDEALLATGFIFLFHFFHTHLRPESFPMDPVIFTGSMPLEKFKEERPLEYERLVATKQLEKYLVPAPEHSNLQTAYIFGFFAVVVGLACAVGIFVALWHQLGR